MARRLERTRQGCELKVARWIALEEALRLNGDWNDAQRRLALDLLGVPAEDRDGPSPIDPVEDEPVEGSSVFGPWAPAVLHRLGVIHAE